MYELFSIFNRVTRAKDRGQALQPVPGMGLAMWHLALMRVKPWGLEI